MLKYLIICLTIISILGCDKSAKDRFESLKLVEYEPEDSIQLIKIKTDTLFFHPPLDGDYTKYQTVQQEKHYLYIGLEPKDYRLDFFSLETNSVINSIKFDYDGPNGIKGRMDGFFYHNQDSIFVLSIDANTVYLVNEEAEVLDKYEFNRISLPDGFSEYNVYAHEGLHNGPYYVPSNKTLQLYMYRWNYGDQDEFENPLMVSYSIESRKFISAYGNYPNNYQKDNDYLFYENPIVIVNDTTTFLQFGISEQLSAYNNKTGELLYFTRDHCEHWAGATKPLPKNHTFQEGTDWLIQEAFYPILLLDKEKQLLYRALKHRQPLLDSDNLLNDVWLGSWSIEVFDLQLKKLGHIEFEKNKFLPVVSFTASGELWVKNPIVPENENISLFYVLNLE